MELFRITHLVGDEESLASADDGGIGGLGVPARAHRPAGDEAEVGPGAVSAEISGMRHFPDPDRAAAHQWLNVTMDCFSLGLFV